MYILVFSFMKKIIDILLTVILFTICILCTINLNIPIALLLDILLISGLATCSTFTVDLSVNEIISIKIAYHTVVIFSLLSFAGEISSEFIIIALNLAWIGLSVLLIKIEQFL